MRDCLLPQEDGEALYDRALEAAAKQLSYRMLSAQALAEKLVEKGFPEDAAEYAVAWLTERELLDDNRFAESVVQSYERRGYGRMRIAQELRKRGVARQDADEALSGYAANQEKMTALLEKRLRGDLSDRKEVDRAIAALQRRGYQWEEIRQALGAYGASLPETFD